MPKPFVPAGTEAHYTPDRPVGVEHVRLELDLDLAKRKLAGRAVLSLVARRDDLQAVTLHAVEMEISAVAVNDRPTKRFDYDGLRLRIELDRAHRRDERLTVSVTYSCTPRRGLYFIGPDEHNPERPLQCWSQGQDEDSRHFWPGVDAPIEKATSEIICTAPRGLTVLSNGELRERRDVDGDRTRWHYRLDFPHSSYLVTLVCGTFVELKDKAPATGVDVYYFVPPGREADARRSFGRTPEMIDVFSRKIGLPYPHSRYSQIVVSEFIFGGMENTTATTLTDQTLLDERAALDHTAEALVAHELAHQWWGNLLTCREWPEAWLNEGFATFFEYVWHEHARGRDEADVELFADTESYFSEASKYQRPIVCRHFEEPIDLFDAHLYDKGGRVLHMLRHDLGDETFWRAITLYATRHARGSVETRDLARAVEQASGRNFDKFFDQWVQSPGHAELECSWEWNDDKKVGTLRVDQKQSGDKTYVFPVRVWLEIDGQGREESLAVRDRTHAFELALPGKPTQVIFDPGDVILKTIKMEKARPLWVRQLKAAPMGVDRVIAARALGDKPEPAAVTALREALENDSFWAVRAAAAAALGRTRREDARDALLAAQKQDHPRVRRAAALALGEFRGDTRAAEALAAWAERGDPSYFAEANAALALGRTRSPRALDVLPKVLTRRSYQDVIKTRALEGLGACGHDDALPMVQAAYQPGASFQSRRAAVAATGRLSEGTPHARRTRDFLELCLDDRDFRVRMEAAAALVLLGDGRATAALERALAREMDGRARRRLREALSDLRERGKPSEHSRKQADELERLRGETIKLRERIEKLEARHDKASKTGPSSNGTTPAPRRPAPKARRGSKPARPPRRR